MRNSGYITIKFREIEHLPLDKREEILNACINSQEYKRGRRNVRIVGFIGLVLTTCFVVALRWLVPGLAEPLAKGPALIYAAVPTTACLVLCFILPIYLDVRRVKALVRKKLRESNC